MSYFDVAGTSHAELRRSLDRERVRAVPGARHDAHTLWNLAWRSRVDRSEAGCAVMDVETEMSTEVVLPRWSSDGSASPELASSWSRYREALAAHENGHVEIARQTQAALERALRAVPPQESCEELNLLVEATARRTLDAFREAHRHYDRATHHGGTQGAILERPARH